MPAMIKLKRFIRQAAGLAALALGLVGLSPAHAQFTSDIDIYSGTSSAGNAPNVLIVLDNTANWSSAFNNEIAALVNTFRYLPVDRFRVGLMMFTESGNGNTGPDGGYVRAALRLLDANYKLRLDDLLTGLHVTNDRTNGGKAGVTMAEAYYYLAGKTPYSGNNKNKTDYTGNTFGNAASRAIYSLEGNALGSRDGSPYASPVTNSCERNYIIYISNGPVQDNSSDSVAASSLLTAAYNALGVPRPRDDLSLSPSGSQSGLADE